MPKLISRKKMVDGVKVSEELRLIQIRIPKNLAITYSTILKSKDISMTSHLEGIVIEYIRDEKNKMEINK